MRRAQWAGCACAVLASLLTGCEKERLPPSDAGGGKVVIVTSVFPIADLVRRIGGNRVEVRCLLEPGHSPHGYSPALVRADQFSGVRLLIVVGAGLDDWAVKAARDAKVSARIVELTRDADFLHTYSTYMGRQAAAAIQDPNLWGRPPLPQTRPASRQASEELTAAPDGHVWLDPVFMQNLAATVLDELAREDPASARAYTHDANACLQDLIALDREYREALSAVRAESNCFLAYEPAFGYIARRYGLTPLSLDGTEAAPLSEERMDEVRGLLKERKVKAIFTEQQFPTGQLEALAREIGVRPGRLDAIGNAYEPGYDSYQTMMRSNLRALVKGLEQGG